MKRRRLFFWTTVLLLILVGLPALLIYRQVRQERLDVALVTALYDENAPRALTALQQGADPNVRMRKPENLSYWEHLRVLLRVRTAPKSRSGLSPTTLEYAFIWSEDENARVRAEWNSVIEALLKHGADPNALDYEGLTPLMQAAMTGNRTVIQMLLDHGADTERRSRDGYTALMCASETDAQTMQILIDNGADVEAQSTQGWTALRFVVSNYVLTKPPDIAAMTRVLLAHGARNVPDRSGKTPLDIAKREKMTEVARLIQEAERKRQKP
jgi:ankyrin repeat protein